MGKLTKMLSLAFGLVMMFGVSAQATLLTSNTMTGATVIDFNSQATLVNVAGPISLGNNVIATGGPNSGLYTNYNSWGLASNGMWGRDMTYISADNARPGALIFEFLSGPVSGVGGFINHAPGFGTDLIISAFSSTHTLLEQYDVTALAGIVTPNGINAGGFRGIQRTSADISYFEVFGYVPVLDNLTFTAAEPVPEPSTFLLLGAGLGGLAIWRRKKQSES